MIRVHAGHHAGNRVVLPGGDTHDFDDAGFSGEVSQATADMCAGVPGFSVHDDGDGGFVDEEEPGTEPGKEEIETEPERDEVRLPYAQKRALAKAQKDAAKSAGSPLV